MTYLTKLFCLGVSLLSFSITTYAYNCPDPHTSSLQWGEIPKPWLLNPFSAQKPQADKDTQFVRANILVASYGQGVVCTYKNSLGEYSIWWQARTKIPPPTEMLWIKTLGGYVCTQGLLPCTFTVAS